MNSLSKTFSFFIIVLMIRSVSFLSANLDKLVLKGSIAI